MNRFETAASQRHHVQRCGAPTVVDTQTQQTYCVLKRQGPFLCTVPNKASVNLSCTVNVLICSGQFILTFTMSAFTDIT